LAPLLFISILLIAACGLIYELIAGALASYLLGDSITQFLPMPIANNSDDCGELGDAIAQQIAGERAAMSS